jgi:DNA-binding winged helix-turn-helix (wHTH) protein
MLHRFSNFEIDEAKRELRVDGRAVLTQRRVFDLLVYLARHRERVVPKDELLDAVWPGVLVTDNSLQRAVSLARTALKCAGACGAIRTYLRQGYRLCAEAAAPVAAPSERPKPAALRRAYGCYARGAWDEAIEELRQLDDAAALAAEDLQFWAHVAQCAGRPLEAVTALERAVAMHHAGGDHSRAAWAALLLAQLRMDWREPALAKGWVRRATRLLSGAPEGREHGYLSFIRCRLALVDSDFDAAAVLADEARAIAQRFHDADLESLGLLYGGEARVYRGDVEEGLACIDEAGVSVTACNLSPWAGGLVYCGIIFSSLTRADWHRAAQWNHQFERWCEWSGAPGAMGLCRLHRAEVLCVQGELAQAEQEARLARAALARTSPWAEGDAWRVLGEVQLARGDWSGARDSMYRAHEYGWDARFGLALLEHAQGRSTRAHRLLARALRDPNWANRARRGLMLAHATIIAAGCGRLDQAREALTELEAHPELVSTSALQALVAQARAEVAAASGDAAAAIEWCQTALRRWSEIEAPLLAAQTRCRLARLLEHEGDIDSAALELKAARAAFSKAGALGLLEQCERGARTVSGARAEAPGHAAHHVVPPA